MSAEDLASAFLAAKFGTMTTLRRVVSIDANRAIEPDIVAAIHDISAKYCKEHGCRDIVYFNGRLPPGNLVQFKCPCSAKYVKILPECRVYASGNDRIIFVDRVLESQKE